MPEYPGGLGRRFWSLWVSDLYEPVNDPDDHYDLAVAMADPSTFESAVVEATNDAPVARAIERPLTCTGGSIDVSSSFPGEFCLDWGLPDLKA